MCKWCHGILAVVCVKLRGQSALLRLYVTQRYSEAEIDKHIHKVVHCDIKIREPLREFPRC